MKRPARNLSEDELESLDEQETLGTCFKDSDYGEKMAVVMVGGDCLLNSVVSSFF